MLDCVGFESGDLLECYDSLGVTLISAAGAARHGGYCGRLRAVSGDAAWVQLGASITPSSTQQTRIAFGVRLRALPSSACSLAVLVQAGSPVLYVALEPSGALALYGSSSSPLDTSAAAHALSAGQYYFLEFDVPTVSGGSYGTAKVYVDGAEVLSASVIPALSATGTYHAVVGTLPVGSVLVETGGLDCYLDDLVLARLSGTAPVAAWGSAQVNPLLPATDLDLDDWPGTSDGDSTYEALGIIPATSWAHATAVGQTPSGKSILAVIAKARGRAASTPAAGEGMMVGLEQDLSGTGYTRLREWSGTSFVTGAHGLDIEPANGFPWVEVRVDDYNIAAYRYNGIDPAVAGRLTAAGLYLLCTADVGAGGTDDPEGGAGADPTDTGGMFLFW